MSPQLPNVHGQHSPASLSPLYSQSSTEDAGEQNDQHGPQLPPGTGKLGMWLFLAALFMLFAASLAAYAVIRITGDLSPEFGIVKMPAILWGSTLAMIASSITMHMALSRIRSDNILQFKVMMRATIALALLFLVLQVPGMWILLSDHYQSMSKEIHIYGLLFVLVLLHAAHIVGGLIPLVVCNLKAQKDLYTQTDHNAIVYLTMYWHFLDGVWLAMFGLFLVLG